MKARVGSRLIDRPEFKSKPTAPHPLFREFIKSSINSKVGLTNG